MIPLLRRQLLLQPKTVLLFNCAAIVVYILYAVGRALCRLRDFVCLRPNVHSTTRSSPHTRRSTMVTLPKFP